MATDTLRPTNHYDPGGDWTTPNEAYDTFTGTAGIGANLNPGDIYFGRDAANADAWSGAVNSYNAVTIYLDHYRYGATDDWTSCTIETSAGVVKHTILNQALNFSRTTDSVSLNAADWGGIGFPNIADLRVHYWGDVIKGSDGAQIEVFEIWMVATLVETHYGAANCSASESMFRAKTDTEISADSFDYGDDGTTTRLITDHNGEQGILWTPVRNTPSITKDSVSDIEGYLTNADAIYSDVTYADLDFSAKIYIPNVATGFININMYVRYVSDNYYVFLLSGTPNTLTGTIDLTADLIYNDPFSNIQLETTTITGVPTGTTYNIAFSANGSTLKCIFNDETILSAVHTGKLTADAVAVSVGPAKILAVAVHPAGTIKAAILGKAALSITSNISTREKELLTYDTFTAASSTWLDNHTGDDGDTWTILNNLNNVFSICDNEDFLSGDDDDCGGTI